MSLLSSISSRKNVVSLPNGVFAHVIFVWEEVCWTYHTHNPVISFIQSPIMKLIGIMLAIYVQRKIYTISTQWYKISCGGLFTMFMNLFSHVGQQKN
ncbi:hypothetical protein ACFX19_026043 [Malus domestica]